MTQEQLRGMFAPTNDRLREIHRLLNFYTYNEQELEILHKEVLGAMAKRAKKKLAEDSDEAK